MLTLFIDTIEERNQIIIFRDEKILVKKSWLVRRDNGVNLFSSLKTILNSAKIKLKDCKEIVVVSGPGGFSAVRIGVTAANLLAFSLNIPVCGVKKEEDIFSKRKMQSEFVAPFYICDPNITKKKLISE